MTYIAEGEEFASNESQLSNGNALIGEMVMSKARRIGIQGGPGSFNDSALRQYLERHPESTFDVSYLNSTHEVLEKLERGQIEYGQFALFNSQAGFYEESLFEIGRYRFEVEEAYDTQISHCLMTHRDVNIHSIETVMSHREVLKQCKANLEKRYPDVRLVEGAGDLADPARVGEALSKGTLDSSTAVVSNGLIAELHGLSIVERDLQDAEDNVSTFLLVSRF